jgi:hypothetical protein
MQEPAAMTRIGTTSGPEIVVTGSIGNLGPGFDALSLAVQLYLRVRVLAVLPDEPDTLRCDVVGALIAGEKSGVSRVAAGTRDGGRRPPDTNRAALPPRGATRACRACQETTEIWSWRNRVDGVVPLAVEPMPLETHGRHLRIGPGDTGRAPSPQVAPYIYFLTRPYVHESS